MGKPIYRYKKRAFLNKEHDQRAHIIAHVRKGARYDASTLEIADCTRHISLDFYIDDDKKSMDKVEKKLELFVGIINEWAEAMREEIAYRRNGGAFTSHED